MINIFLILAFIIVAYYLGDWKNWKLYQSTILFFLYGDMAYHFLTSFNYPLWIHKPSFPIHTHMVLTFLMEIIFVCTILIFLGRYPKERKKSLLWIGSWIIIYSLLEGGLHLLGRMEYQHGWTWFYSALFNVMMFPMLRLHYKAPLIAYAISVPITIFLIIITKLPLH